MCFHRRTAPGTPPVTARHGRCAPFGFGGGAPIMLVMWLEGPVPSCSTPRRRIRSAAAPVCLALAVVAVISWSCAKDAPASPAPSILKIGARGKDEAPAIIRSMLFAEGLMAIDGHGQPIER